MAGFEAPTDILPKFAFRGFTRGKQALFQIRELARLDELRVEVKRHNRVCQMTSAVSQLAELRRFSADRRIDVDDEDARRRAQRQMKRDVEFISSLKEGADALAEILDEAIARFDAALGG